MQLGTAMLFVKDLPRMRDFYTRMFGADPLPSEWPEQWVPFDLGGACFALHAIPEEIGNGMEIASPPQPREDASIKLTFEVDDVRAESARIEALGAILLPRSWQEPNEWCDAADPEGNVFQLARRK